MVAAEARHLQRIADDAAGLLGQVLQVGVHVVVRHHDRVLFLQQAADLGLEPLTLVLRGSGGTRAQACLVEQTAPPSGCSYSTSSIRCSCQLLQAHGEIRGLHVLGQRADGDAVHAGLRRARRPSSVTPPEISRWRARR
jgi:hypothetical protein